MNQAISANLPPSTGQRVPPDQASRGNDLEDTPANTSLLGASSVDGEVSLTRMLLLSASVTLANLCLGFSFHTVTVTLNQLAEDLNIAEGNLQWASNSHLLTVVSVFSSALFHQASLTYSPALL
jgi:hypothetical protein